MYQHETRLIYNRRNQCGANADDIMLINKAMQIKGAFKLHESNQQKFKIQPNILTEVATETNFT